MKIKLAIVCPCFNEEEILELSIKKLQKKLDELIKKGICSEESYIVLVDDGSLDNTWDLIKLASEKNKKLIIGIKLVKNSGHQNALMAGIKYVTGNCDACITMDVDLQDDINIIDSMLKYFNLGYKIVLGVKKRRIGDSYFKKITAKIYYKLMKYMGVDIIENHADCRLLSDQALRNFSLFSEKVIFIRALQMNLHSKIAVVEYDIKAREFGSSKYNLNKMLKLAWDGITSFSIVPLRMIGVFGLIISMVSLVMVGVALFAYVEEKSVPGWASTIIPVYIMGGISMLSIGVLGEYIGKIYEEVKKRPNYIIDEILE